MRIMHEAQMHEKSWFVTLTYEEVPENASLDPEDFRRFIANLGKEHDAGTVSYYACGEYGESSQRPHYHAVLFGPEFLDRYEPVAVSRTGVWRSEALDSYWSHGFTELGSLTLASASYVAGYVRKKVRKQEYPDHYTRVDPETGELVELQPEFARMSSRPAIGRRWLERYWRDVYPRDFVVFGGFEAKPPRYYDKWMDDNHPTIMEQVRQKRWDEHEELLPPKLAAKEKIHEARVNLFSSRGAI